MQRPAKPLTPVRFRLQPPFTNSNFSELQFSKVKIGWLGDIQGQYLFEEGILELNEKALHSSICFNTKKC